jgi:hypothetical protein
MHGYPRFFYGKASRYIQQHCDSALVAYVATIPLLIPGMYFETALAEPLGGRVQSGCNIVTDEQIRVSLCIERVGLEIGKNTLLG